MINQSLLHARRMESACTRRSMRTSTVLAATCNHATILSGDLGVSSVGKPLLSGDSAESDPVLSSDPVRVKSTSGPLVLADQVEEPPEALQKALDGFDDQSPCYSEKLSEEKPVNDCFMRAGLTLQAGTPLGRAGTT
uniref:Uncharacterized protein n=1 Tax=Timema cristinae TaxID=61476 RepID=A0A7R9DB66_TIMCR|nr:unnamed protein product [Timema cristinae]